LYPEYGSGGFWDVQSCGHEKIDYNGESVNKSQMGIKHKTCDI
jgi:hypothetical protein